MAVAMAMAMAMAMPMVRSASSQASSQRTQRFTARTRCHTAQPIGRNQNRHDVWCRHRPAADPSGRTDEPVAFSAMCWCEGSKDYSAADERR